ncbi:MAG: PocR ligand-binding domain-containing protein [Treponema sp.]|nr:PocR ligand-binding domain-containing protein [Treponema sp.]
MNDYIFMKSIDLFFDEQVNKLMISFSYCFKVHLTIFPLDIKNPLKTGYYTTHCSYCKLIRGGGLGYDDRCLQQDIKMCRRSESSLTPIVYTCHAGLIDAAFPIKLNDEVVGYAMAGQFRTKRSLPAAIMRDWQNKGFDPAMLQKAFMDQPYFEKDAADNMINLFLMLCDFIISRDYIRLRRLDITRLVIQWITDHVAEPITLAEVADHLGYSQSSISHIIKGHLGMSFKELCILKKIERFETIVMSTPSLSVEKAAAQVGYEDPFYFSRVYKKVRVMPPSAFINAARKGAIPTAYSNAHFKQSPPDGGFTGPRKG